MSQATVAPSRTRIGSRPGLIAWNAVFAVSDVRRAANRERDGLGIDLRCECARPSCRETIAASAETHRGVGQRFIVVPAHVGAGTVVRAADRFFVVELHQSAGVFAAPATQPRAA